MWRGIVPGPEGYEILASFWKEHLKEILLEGGVRGGGVRGIRRGAGDEE